MNAWKPIAENPKTVGKPMLCVVSGFEPMVVSWQPGGFWAPSDRAEGDEWFEDTYKPDWFAELTPDPSGLNFADPSRERVVSVVSLSVEPQ